MKLLVTVSLFLLSTTCLLAQNVGIGTDNPDGSAKLEISSTNSGVLLPRVALTGTGSASPITSPATSLLVYNTATVSDVTPGYYYWTGSAWERLQPASEGSSTAWDEAGNTGTGSTFLGTTGAFALPFRTNNTERMRLSSTGDVGIGLTTPTNRLDISEGTRTGTHSSTCGLYVTSNAGTASNGFEFRHINGTQGIGLGYNTIYAAGSDANQGLGIATKGTGNLWLGTNGFTNLMILGASGNVGVGTNTPGTRLEVNGQVKITGGSPGADKVLTDVTGDGTATWETPFGGRFIHTEDTRAGCPPTAAAGSTLLSQTITMANDGFVMINAQMPSFGNGQFVISMQVDGTAEASAVTSTTSASFLTANISWSGALTAGVHTITLIGQDANVWGCGAGFGAIDSIVFD